MKDRITNILTVLAVVAFPLCGGCLHHFTMMSAEALRQELQSRMSDLPSVAVVTPVNVTGKRELAFGSAVVVRERQLLLSRHEIAEDHAIIVVNGRPWSYDLVEAVDDPMNDVGGWVLVQLSKLSELSDEAFERLRRVEQLSDYQVSVIPSDKKQDQAALEMPPPAPVDFTSALPVGTPVAVAYNRTYAESETISLSDPMSAIRIERGLVTGRVVRRSLLRHPHAAGMLQIDTGDETWGDQGGSGSPVYAWFRGQEEPVVIGVCGGISTWTSDRTGKETITLLVRRPHELVME